nr:(2Fe-2S)-binding protein [Haloferax sp. BAB-2207]
MIQDSTSTTVIRASVNGEDEQFAVSSGETLMETLRGAGYYGVKNGCDEGVCGACNVILGDEGVTRSCLVPAASCDGAEVMTVEGLADDDGGLHPLQSAFLEHGAAQCGYCIPGVLLASYDLLQRTDEPTESEVADALSGNICRCTGYVQQIEAVQAAADRLSGSDASSEGSG